MKNESKKRLILGAGMLVLFVLWTVLITFVDVQPIGPENSAVGFATANGWFHQLVGVNMALYTVTDWLGLVPIAVVLGFALLGLCQWIRRKGLQNVDFSILVLGGAYVLTFAVYALFEVVVVNYRPVLIGGILEASYPSSTTLLTLCVMPTAMHQLGLRIQNSTVKKLTLWILGLFTAFMVIGRLISGVHWLSDIIGGILFSAALISLYTALCGLKT